MRWGRAHRAEIVGRADQTFAEVMLPDAVDQHASGERVVLARDGVGQLQPATAKRERTANRAREAFEKTARNDFAEVLRFASDEHGRVSRSGPVKQNIGSRRSARMSQFQSVNAILQFNPLAKQFPSGLWIGPADLRGK